MANVVFFTLALARAKEKETLVLRHVIHDLAEHGHTGEVDSAMATASKTKCRVAGYVASSLVNLRAKDSRVREEDVVIKEERPRRDRPSCTSWLAERLPAGGAGETSQNDHVCGRADRQV